LHYRKFGSLGFDVSALGFGAMRLPVKDGKVDEELACAMIRRAIDAGVNYVDTAYPYHEGTSEVVVGKALRDGYRQKVKLATKLPSWQVRAASDFDTILDTQLERLKVESLDFYLLHSLNKTAWAKLRDLGIIPWAERAIAQGRFAHLAFSFHDDAEVFRDIVDAYDWSMCQVQYNFMDVGNQAGAAGVKHAASKGIAVVVMEPLLGGKLVDPPPVVQAVWDGAARKRSSVAWALDWLWDQPEVSTVLSGMTAMEQVEQNLELAAKSQVGALRPEERALYDVARERYAALTLIPCTKCGYCMPCPHGVDIPGNLGVYNEGLMFDKQAGSRDRYAWLQRAFEVTHILDHDVRAVQCVQCDECLDKCPQSIPISSWMPVIDKALGENGPFLRDVPPR
jgi:uncharacterized protein